MNSTKADWWQEMQSRRLTQVQRKPKSEDKNVGLDGNYRRRKPAHGASTCSSSGNTELMCFQTEVLSCS